MENKQNPSIIRVDDQFGTTARIKVIGVGGAGGNAVNHMVRNGLVGVEYIAINTDKLALENSMADYKIGLGENLTRGLGAGARPEVGRQAILESREAVVEAIQGADMLFITAGMGGGTGIGAAPVVAEIARELGILTVAVITTPFLFEGPVRSRTALVGVEEISKIVDTYIVVQNQKLMLEAPRKMLYNEAFKMADDVLANAVQGISEIILKHGHIQVDFADIKTVMEHGGSALMGTGIGEGENRAVDAAERAIKSPLLNEIDICGSTSVLVNISHGSDFGIHELEDAMHYIYDAVGDENQPNIIFGQVEDTSEAMLGKVSITVIATGFSNKNSNAFAQSATIQAKPASQNPTATSAPVVPVAAVAPVVTPVVAEIVPEVVAIAMTEAPTLVASTVAAPMSASPMASTSVSAPMALESSIPVAKPISTTWKMDAQEEQILGRRPVAEYQIPEAPRAKPISQNAMDMGYDIPKIQPQMRNVTQENPVHREEDMNNDLSYTREINLDTPAYLRNGI